MKLLVIAFCIVALSLGLFSELGGGVPTLISNRRGQEKINPNRNTVDLTCREDGSDIPSTFWNGTTRLNSMVSATHTHVLTPDTEAGLSCRNEAGVPSNERRLAALPQELNLQLRPPRNQRVQRGQTVELLCDYPPGNLRDLYEVFWSVRKHGTDVDVTYRPNALPFEDLLSINEDTFSLTVAANQTGDQFHCIVDVRLNNIGSGEFRYLGATIELEVEEPAVIVEDVQDVTVIMGEMATFTCGVMGRNLELSWEIDNHAYTGCSEPSFCVTNTRDSLMVRSTFAVDTETANLDNNTEVICKASQMGGTEVSSTARLIFATTMEPMPSPTSDTPTTEPTLNTGNNSPSDDSVLSEEVQTLIFVLAGIVAFVIVVIIVVISCVCSLRILYKQGKITTDSRVIRNRPLLQRMVSGERYPRINHSPNEYHDYEHMDAELGSLRPGSEVPAHFFQPSDVSDQEEVYNLSRGSGGSSIFLPRHTPSVSIPGSQTNLQQPFDRISYPESESEHYQKLFPNNEGRERKTSQNSTQSTGNLSAEVSRMSPAPTTMAMPPGYPNNVSPKITAILESVTPSLISDEILRHVVGCLMHRQDCQIPRCPCRDVQQRYRELLIKDVSAAQEPPKPPPCDGKKPHFHLSLSQQNLGSNEHPHWHLHTKSHIRHTQRKPLLRQRSKSVDLTPIIEMRETPVIEKRLTPTPIDEKRVLRRASFRFQADCDSPDGQEDPNWRPPLLREISLSADNLPALCLNDCPLTPSPLRENRTLVAAAMSPLREQRSRWVHKPKLDTLAENTLSVDVESSSEDGSNTSSRSVSAASIANEDITKEKTQVEENPSTPKQLHTSTSVPESGYDTNYSDTEGNSDKLSRKHLHHESLGRLQVHTSPQPPPSADEHDTRAAPPPMPAHLQGRSPTHQQGHSPTHQQGRSPTHQQEYGHSHLREHSPAYLQKCSPTHQQLSHTHSQGHSPNHLLGHSPTHQATQHSPTHRYRTSSTGHATRGRSPLRLPEPLASETLC